MSVLATPTPPTATAEPKPYQCRNIFADGHQCGSRAHRQEIFCYYHHTTRRPPRSLRSRGGYSCYEIAMPEDRASLQCSLNEVLRLLAAGDIDFKRATLLLRGLAICSSNLNSLARNPQPARETALVDDTVFHPDLGPIAPEPILEQPFTADCAREASTQIQAPAVPAQTQEPTPETPRRTAENLPLIRIRTLGRFTDDVDLDAYEAVYRTRRPDPDPDPTPTEPNPDTGTDQGGAGPSAPGLASETWVSTPAPPYNHTPELEALLC